SSRYTPTSPPPSKASGLSDAHHQDDQWRAHRSRRRSARDHGSALPGSDGQARARALVRGHGEGDPPSDRADGRRRPADLPGREPVPQYREIRERQARSLHEEADQAVAARAATALHGAHLEFAGAITSPEF